MKLTNKDPSELKVFQLEWKMLHLSKRLYKCRETGGKLQKEKKKKHAGTLPHAVNEHFAYC